MKMLNNALKAIRQYADCLIYLSLLTLFMLFKEISYFIQCNKGYFYDFNFMSYHMALPWSMGWQVLYFILAQLLLHFGFTVLIALFVIAFASTFRLSPEGTVRFSVFSWLIAFLTIVLVNKLYYPNSKSAEIISFFLTTRVAYSLLFINAIISTIMLFMLLYMWLKRYTKQFLLFTAIMGFGVGGVLLFWPSNHPMYSSAATVERPNIIIIGVDSLRPDFLGYNGYPIQTTFMNGFLDTATVFSETLTPIARTFPSWMTIITGSHPKKSGIRSNLVDMTHFDFSQTIGYQLHQQGYETIFATDETRFSNIDTKFGFDKTITPPIGIDDFLLGSLNDFPLSNILVNTAVGHFFFPNSYANRPVYFTYNPDSFLKTLDPLLLKNRTNPLFLAIHFCLPHHPYVWSGENALNKNVETLYGDSIERVDRQIQDFFAKLQQAHLLDHAMVILLSDHGEAMALKGDRLTEQMSFISPRKSSPPKFYSASLDKEDINQSAGHGTDVLSLVQYHTVLAFKLYGLGNQFMGQISGVNSLLDIKPTILNLVNRKAENGSLLKYIRGEAKALPNKRHIFIESDFSPRAIRTVYPDTRQVILEGIAIFQINLKNLRLTVRPDMLKKIINSKQYADIYDHWMLALYPQPQGGRMPILINLDNGLWTNDLHSKFALSSPADKMLLALNDFYLDEIGKII